MTENRMKHRHFACRSLLGLVLLCALPTPGLSADAATDLAALRKSVQLANGMTLGYIELGDVNNPPLVFLHGYTNSSLGYVPLGRLLARKHRVLLLDLRGHGISDKPECCYSRVNFAHDIKLFLDQKGIKTADIAGHSLGSMVAQTFAAYWPEYTRRLIVIAGTMGNRSPASPSAGRSPPMLKSYDAPIRTLTDPIDPDSPFMVAWWTIPNVDPEMQRIMRRESANMPAAVWRAILDQGESSRDLRTTAHRIKAPTLLMVAGKDSLFGAKERKELKAWLPGAKEAYFAELGHSLPEENPAIVAQSMSEFLQP